MRSFAVSTRPQSSVRMLSSSVVFGTTVRSIYVSMAHHSSLGSLGIGQSRSSYQGGVSSAALGSSTTELFTIKPCRSFQYGLSGKVSFKSSASSATSRSIGSVSSIFSRLDCLGIPLKKGGCFLCRDSFRSFFSALFSGTPNMGLVLGQAIGSFKLFGIFVTLSRLSA